MIRRDLNGENYSIVTSNKKSVNEQQRNSHGDTASSLLEMINDGKNNSVLYNSIENRALQSKLNGN